MVENVRVGRRVFQRQVLYLGELNDSQREEWQRAIEAFDEKGNVRQLKLFLRMHTNWLANTAVEELIGPGALTGRSTLYSCLDRVIWNSEEWKKPLADG